MKSISTNSESLLKHKIPLPKYAVGQLVASENTFDGLVVGVVTGMEWKSRISFFDEEGGKHSWHYCIWWLDESINQYRPWIGEEQVDGFVDHYEELVMKQ
jgi:hypothetical protein